MLSPEAVGPHVVTHKPTCAAPAIKVRAGHERGVYIVTCRKCSVLGLADENGSPVLTPRAAAPAPAARTQYRCPEHGTPVTWRGTGCQPCQQDRDTYRQRRIERRAAALTDHAQPEGI